MGMAAGPITVDELLNEARGKLRRLTPEDAKAEMANGVKLADIRSDAQREEDGLIPGAVYVPRNVLEWRLDPACADRNPELGTIDARVALICVTSRVLLRLRSRASGFARQLM
jgi:hypothetical protein